MITSEKEYRDTCQAMDRLIAKGTELGNMELLNDADKNEYIRLSAHVREWEHTHYPFPIAPNPLVAEIQERMSSRNLKQRDTARILGIDESRMSEIMRGKRSISMKLAKTIRKELNISADVIMDFA